MEGPGWLLWASHRVRGRVSMQYREELVGSGPCRIRHVEMCLGVKGHLLHKPKCPSSTELWGVLIPNDRGMWATCNLAEKQPAQSDSPAKWQCVISESSLLPPGVRLVPTPCRLFSVLVLVLQQQRSSSAL